MNFARMRECSGARLRAAPLFGLQLARGPDHNSAVLQVVYPALEHKVRNVTHSYSVEHGEEVRICTPQHLRMLGAPAAPVRHRLCAAQHKITPMQDRAPLALQPWPARA
jgi:hypothetical protein